MSELSTSEINIGELRARVEWETIAEDGTVTVRPKRIQLVLQPASAKVSGMAPFSPVVVLGDIEEAS